MWGLLFFFLFYRCNHDRLTGKGKIINEQYYATELRQLNEVIKSKRGGKLRTSVPTLQDKVRVHSAHVTIAEVVNCDFKLLCYLTYSPDSASPAFF